MSLRLSFSRLLRPRLRIANAHAHPYRYLAPALSAHAKLLSTLPDIPIFRALKDHDPASLAVVHSVSTRAFTYGNLIADVLRAKDDLERKTKTGKLAGERVAFLAENSYDYVGTVTYSENWDINVSFSGLHN